MLIHSVLPAVLLQTTAVVGLTPAQVNILMVFAGAVTLAVLVQCAILISFALGAAKARKEFLGLAHDVHGKVSPVISKVDEIVKTSGPLVNSAIANLEEVSAIARNKAVELDSLTTEMVMRTRQQTRRVDGMVTHTLTRVEHVRDTLHEAVMTPVRQIVGLVAGAKAMVENFRENLPSGLSSVMGRFNRHEAEARVGEGEDYHA